MSAIGNYIYYSASNYYMGNQNETGKSIGQSDLKYRNKEAVNARKHQKQLIDNRYKQRGNKQVARQMEEVFNLFSSTDDVAAQSLKDSGIEVDEIKKAITEKLNDLCNRNNKNSFKQNDIDLNHMTISNRDLSNGVRQVVSKLKTGEGINSREDLIKELNNLLTQMMKAKKTTLDYLEKTHTSTKMEKTVVGRVGSLIKFLEQEGAKVSKSAYQYYDSLSKEDKEWLDNYTAKVYLKNKKNTLRISTGYGGFKNAIDSIDFNDFKGLHVTSNKRKQMYGGKDKVYGNPILSEIITLINILETPPPSILGNLAEAAVAVLTEKIPNYLNVTSNITGSERVRYQVKKEKLMSDILGVTIDEEYKNYAKDKTTQEIIEGFNGKIKYRITPERVQPKVDVTFSYQKGEKTFNNAISVKRSSYGNIIHFLKNGDMYNLISANNEENFINHYINIMVPHYVNYKNNTPITTKRVYKNTGPIGENIVINGGMLSTKDNQILHNARAGYEKVMQLVMATNAMFGNRRMIANPTGNLTKDDVNYLAIFVDNADASEGRWYVKTVGDIYKNLIDINNSPIVVSRSMRKDKTSPFAMSDFSIDFKDPPVVSNGDPALVSKVNKIIAQRINMTLAVLHKQSVNVYLRNVELAKIYDSVHM